MFPTGLSAKPDVLSDVQQMTKLPVTRGLTRPPPRRTGCQPRLGSTSSPLPALETDPLGLSAKSDTLLDGQQMTKLPRGTGWEVREGRTRGTGCQATGGVRTLGRGENA